MNLELDGTGTLPFSQLESFTSGRMALSGSVTWTFPLLEDAIDTDVVIDTSSVQFVALTKLPSGSLTLLHGGTANVPLLTEINGASFDVAGGVTLTIPATNYAVRERVARSVQNMEGNRPGKQA